MQRFDSDPYEQPPSYTPPRRAPTFSPSPIASYPIGGPGLDTGLQIVGGGDDRRYFSDPYVGEKGNIGGVSRTGPTASAQYSGAMNPFIRAGSLLSGGLRGAAGFRGGPAYQRGFTVEQQERLRRRKRNRFME